MRIFFDTVGCRLNQSEIERLAREFRAAGHSITGNRGEADLVVVNTCSVTSQAASDSRQKIRQVVRLFPAAQIIATGCWATLEPEETQALSGNVRVVVNAEKDRLTDIVLGDSVSEMDLSLIERQLLPGSRQRMRAFIKVQDGCDACCTYCVTRIARGKSRGEPVERILADIRSALSGGAREIILSGVQLGSWGIHFPTPSRLSDLIKIILTETDVPRLRLSSIEPWDIDPEFFSIFSDSRVCRHLHISLQSGCAATLKRMGRRTSPGEYLEKLSFARQLDPHFSITTDVITGFPGETFQEFAESMEFIRRTGFSGGHVFPFSSRKGTPAVAMPGQVPSREGKQRAARVRQVLEESAAEYRQSLLGRKGRVLWETARPQDGGFLLAGFNQEFIRVTASSPQELVNVISPVQYTRNLETGLFGEILG
ncbi:MAG: tRNA (N(6)-L-threonylcarbamoyladenosine(37)-C(2))-methylthiotransferase MtaB [Leptolinea sp.]|jgi:threonylcarbamoyladenosine tRNA methylthiotransferase MtaB|nr:tRNA (N(6)-L-threonylcarbamoyladenosine(37)-C(2))-methylthiotransferase MtaB [Leptolinea sp.]